MRPNLHRWLPAALLLLAAVVAAGVTLYRATWRLEMDRMLALADRFAAEEGMQPPAAEDRVLRLALLASAEEVELDRRNRAIWALGELGDRRALPYLEALDVQQECDHDRLVCQREVRKAMAKIRGEMSPAYTARRAWGRLKAMLSRLGGS